MERTNRFHDLSPSFHLFILPHGRITPCTKGPAGLFSAKIYTNTSFFGTEKKSRLVTLVTLSPPLIFLVTLVSHSQLRWRGVTQGGFWPVSLSLPRVCSPTSWRALDMNDFSPVLGLRGSTAIDLRCIQSLIS